MATFFGSKHISSPFNQTKIKLSKRIIIDAIDINEQKIECSRSGFENADFLRQTLKFRLN